MKLRLALIVLMLIPATVLAGTRMLRFPDIHNDKIAFVYGGDIYISSSTGGTARQLTSHKGKELFPKFSPDGKWIAFSAEYTGTRQVYVIPAEGGMPTQLTYYNDVGVMPPRGGYDNQVLGWTPDGKNILFIANRTPWSERNGKYYTVPFNGGLETPLPLIEGGYADYSPDGSKLAFTPIAREWRTWKRYRGGRAQDVWIYDIKNVTAEQITKHTMTDNMPVWHGDKVYFTSDRDYTLNLFAYDTKTKSTEKITNHEDFDVLWPSSGPGGIVYQCGGRIWKLNPETKATQALTINIANDGGLSVPYFKNVKSNIQSASISANGKRAVFDARGDLFSVPAKIGETYNLTKTSGVREIYPTCSPDGKTIAYYSDATGEYELYTINNDGSEKPKQITKNSIRWRFAPTWSPDSKKMAFGDKDQMLRWIDMSSGKITDVDHGLYTDMTFYRWSPDSKWIVYVKESENFLTQIYVYSLDQNKTFMLTDGFANNYDPVFSDDGKYMFFLSNRDFNMTFSGYEFDYFYTNPTKIYYAALDDGIPAVIEYKIDEDEKKEDDKKADTPVVVKIKQENFARRIQSLPLANAGYGNLSFSKGKLYYQKNSSLMQYDLSENKESEIISSIQTYEISADGSTILYLSGGTWGICKNSPGQKADDGKLNFDGMILRIEPQAEWNQIYADAWRLMRDWFYDPNMHGYDWEQMRKKYEQLLPSVSHRNDLDFILGELIGEVNAGHTYVNSGDEAQVERFEGGMLGCEFANDGSKYYKIEKIFTGENWHEVWRSPLTEIGVDVKKGEYLISIDGEEISTKENPYKYLQNKAGQVITIQVNNKPDKAGAREYKIKTINSESELRFLDWVTKNREYVAEKSGGKIGYIWLPNTHIEGNRELYRWFYPQVDKDALIFDDRWNGGGFIPSMMIKLLERRVLNYWARRGLDPLPDPTFSHKGPKACLINGYSSSGGDAFPYYFKSLGLGKLIGTRTWGGLIGISGNPAFVDGGFLNIPTFRIMDPDGNWIIENYGVEPDIEVVDRPELTAKGIDPSLDKAIEILLEELKLNPVKKITVPPAPDESK
ncbi:MAG: PD40 domain-containing protein [Desulfobulbaceae bacterium]|nr:PD40 domain-containing protein [Candidatus Kapabacteria bacterium]MBS4000854.1 PD40 domain-containing protein [Desulfobulbaceae bacterium]